MVDSTGQWQGVAVENQLADTLHSKAWGITPENLDAAIKARSHLLQVVYPAFCNLMSLRMDSFKQQLIILHLRILGN